MVGSGGFIEALRGRVAGSDCDQRGRMNVYAYAARIADAMVTLGHAIGGTPEYIAKERRELVTLHQDIAYLSELEAGDLIVMLGGVLSVDREQISFLQRMLRVEDGTCVMRAKVLVRGIDLERRTPLPLEASMQVRARQLLVSETDT